VPGPKAIREARARCFARRGSARSDCVESQPLTCTPEAIGDGHEDGGNLPSGIHDAVAGRRSFRAFALVDDYTRECLAIEADWSLSGERVRRVLERLIDDRGRPETVRSDNGPEFLSRVLEAWTLEQRIEHDFIDPGKPTQNAFIESFNGRLREECLNTDWFLSLKDARRTLEAWRRDYNDERPHSSLGYRTPTEFAQSHALKEAA